MRAAPHIHHRRKNGWTNRAPNWYKHSLGQCAEVMGVGDRECALMRSTTYPAYAAKWHDRSNPKLVQTLIGTMGRSFVDRRSRVRIDARANVCAPPHSHRRPNGEFDRGPNWYKQSLGQWADVIGVGDSQCAQRYISSICGQTAAPIGVQIGANTHWDIGRSYGDRRSRVRIDACDARRNARSTTYPALAPKRLDLLNPKFVQNLIGVMGRTYGGRRERNARRGRAARNRADAAVLRERGAQNKRESIGMEHGAATAASAKCVCGMRAAHIKKKNAAELLSNPRLTRVLVYIIFL
jgi:hypothetical protein